jgi:hypothetical protein
MAGEPIRYRYHIAHAITSYSTTAAIPASHRMPRGEAAQRFSTCKTLWDKPADSPWTRQSP